LEYLIENSLFYRPDDGVLWLRGNNHSTDKVILTATLNRLLLILINHQGITVRREDILKQVWEDYGLDSSNNSLNQYISILRKIFQQFGLGNDIIITRPKEGFFFSGVVDVKTVSTGDVSLRVDGPAISTKASDNLKTNMRIYTLGSISWLLIVIFFLLGLPFITCQIARLDTGSIAESQTVLLGEHDGCEIHFIQGYGNADSLPSMALVKKVSQVSGIFCSAPGILYFYADSRATNGAKGKVFLSSCAEAGNRLSACQEYVANDWESK